MRPSIPLAGLLAASLAAGARTAEALTHEVGPGKTYANVGDVPWESLNAGDTVLIYQRATPYKEKFVLSRVGTPSASITVRGVLGPLGERPVLDGNGATTRPQLDYYSRNRGVIKIGGSTIPFADGITVMPQWIVIENVEIRSARPPYTFTGASGAVESYPNKRDRFGRVAPHRRPADPRRGKGIRQAPVERGARRERPPGHRGIRVPSLAHVRAERQ